MIDLGLARCQALLTALGLPHTFYKSFHIAGTNGKGSVVSYLSSILVSAGHRTGKFTSPHLISPNDSICINDKPISMETYQQVGDFVRNIDTQHQIGATEFETLTAIAFEVFRREKVKYAVIEVGLGGTLDATNVLEANDVMHTAITKISHDHEGFLGKSLEEIASHKAGIMKEAVPCVADGTNAKAVHEVLVRTAKAKHSTLEFVDSLPPVLEGLVSQSDLLLGEFQLQNASVAAKIALAVSVSPQHVAKGLKNTVWRGRLEWIQLQGRSVLVDGAHNKGSAIELAKYAHSNLKGPITWVVAFSKPCAEILEVLVRRGDTVVCTQFGAVEGMPWIKAQEASQIASVAAKLTSKVITESDVKQIKFKEYDNVVVCGSLYLLGAILG